LLHCIFGLKLRAEYALPIKSAVNINVFSDGMFNLWQHSPSKSVRSGLASTFAAQRVESRDGYRWLSTVASTDITNVITEFAEVSNYSCRIAALVVAWYTRSLSDQEIVERSQQLLNKSRHSATTLRELLKHLGNTPAVEEAESSDTIPPDPMMI
jgi:hypothetical protein